MTFDELLEMNLEVGNNKILAVGKHMLSHKTHDKTGTKDEIAPIVKDANQVLSPDSKVLVRRVINYLKYKKLYDKVGKKLDLKSEDIIMKADGGATVNFDDGGSVDIPSYVLKKF